MPSEIFSLAQIYRKILFQIDENETKGLTALLEKNNPEPNDQEIIQAFETISQNVKNKLNSAFSFLKSEKTKHQEQQLIDSCRLFLESAYEKKIKGAKTTNPNSIIYKVLDVHLLEILKYLTPPELAILAKTSKRFATLIKKENLIEKFFLPKLPRDYSKKPFSIQWKIENDGPCILLSPDRLAITQGSFIKILDIQKKEIIQTIEASKDTYLNTAYIKKLTFFSDKSIAISVSNLGEMRIWNTKTWNCLRTIEEMYRLVILDNKVAYTDCSDKFFVQDFEKFIHGSEKLSEFSIKTGNRFSNMFDDSRIAFIYSLPDGGLLITSNLNVIYGYDAQQKLLNTGYEESSITSFTILSETSFVIGTSRGKIDIGGKKNEHWEIWEGFSIVESATPITCLAALDSNRVICGSKDGQVIFCDIHAATYQTLYKSKEPVQFVGVLNSSGDLISVDSQGITILRFSPLTSKLNLEVEEVIAEETEEIETRTQGLSTK